MKILQLLKNYLARLLRLWIVWFWFFALDALGLVVDTFVPTFSPPQWLYVTIAAIGFLVANVKLFAESESERQVLEVRVAQLEALHTSPVIQARAALHELVNVMPELLVEMKQDLASDETHLVREFIIAPNRHVVINSRKPRFIYYEDEHDYLSSKIDRLRECGLVDDVNFPTIFRMTDVFVELLAETNLGV